MFLIFFQRSGRIEEEIQMLQLKLKRIEGIPFGGRRTKIARSQGKKVQITVQQEISRWNLLLFFFSFHPPTLFYFFLTYFHCFGSLLMQFTRELGLGLLAAK